MLKMILLAVILLACAGVGRALSNTRKRRYELISDILASIRVLRLRMLNSMEPVGILLRKSDCFIFSKLGNSLWEGGGVQECWKAYVEKERRRGGDLACLEPLDEEIMDAFFSNLGKSGRDEQGELFGEIIVRLEEAQQQARNLYLDASKLYTALGVFIGIGICILIV